ncbi:Mur ligase family protein [Terrihabitans rhizophilus]|uniref:Mur ligase family protein n=1 Tax=Terrihabitans rhizophilus TaxID=3092662 RepID=A0ABU4RQ07_9HYPH|nr:Mur ligase family protein [Terrihabitans sp. PJ23]MDX6806917.1 Mur ligase family protein [Terrihabitans sp. PJ23]
MSERLERLYRASSEHNPGSAQPGAPVVLFFSASDGNERAHVVHATAASFEEVWRIGCDGLTALMARRGLRGGWLRIDWITSTTPLTVGRLKTSLARVKRNYFRLGLAFGADFETALLEQELNANAALYGGNTVEHAILHEKNLMLYAARRFGSERRIDFSDEAPVTAFTTKGAFCDGSAVHLLDGEGMDTGRRSVARLRPDDVRSLIRSGSDFLARQVGDDGRFIYGYHPCFDRRIEAYNALRHASTTYSMVEAWQVTAEPDLGQAIERALRRLVDGLIRHVVLPDGREAAFLVDVGDEIKLGGNAVALLALAKHAEVAGRLDHLPLMEKLATGILFMQDPVRGSFRHVLNFPDLSLKAAHRTVYYDGEAAFGLMRLYGFTRDPRWIAAVEKAFDHFIAQDHARHHDHWLSYCVNELTAFRPEERYFRFGIHNVADYLDFVRNRVTTFPTLLELMMAARAMLSRLDALPEQRHLLAEVDLAKFRDALEHRAHYLLNGHFWPEMAMYFRRPDKIVGSFFIRHHGFRVRIDDVEHYLSGLIAYLDYLDVRDDFERIASEANSHPVSHPNEVEHGARWSPALLAKLTGGTWLVPPAPGWAATGLSTYAPAMQPGNIVAVRVGKDPPGVPKAALPRLEFSPSALIVQETGPGPAMDVPVLGVPDVSAAIIAMGTYARSRMSGKVLAVTGSAGKTTTAAMLAHALGGYGEVAQTAHNANLPHGVAWNLASMPWGVDHAVLELAVGRMGQSARMVRPDIAVFTNVLPAHLKPGSTIQAIARTKAAIFSGMSRGGTAVLNRDMQEWQTVHAAAEARGLRIVHFGEAEGCDARLLDYDQHHGEVLASLRGEEVRYRLGVIGRHMAINSLAVLAAVQALDLDAGPALERLSGFMSLSQRGEAVHLSLDSRRLKVIDDTYNANPGSMQAALERLAKEAGSGRRIAVLGEMAELGPGAPSHHDALANTAVRLGIDSFHLVGALYSGMWDALAPERKGSFHTRFETLLDVLDAGLRDGDIVLVKGSRSAGMDRVVDWMKARASEASAALEPRQAPA